MSKSAAAYAALRVDPRGEERRGARGEGIRPVCRPQEKLAARALSLIGDRERTAPGEAVLSSPAVNGGDRHA